ncbi:MAG: reverse transcriptase domain-containing protein, partial [bacterium]
ETDYVLLLFMSLYGLRQAAERWFDTLSKSLIKRGFRQSKIDPCLFYHDKMICIIYSNDCLFFAPVSSDINKMINDLHQEFELVVEQDVTTYLGLEVNNKDDGTIETNQPFLIQRILEATNMTDCNTKDTPALTTPLHKDEFGKERQCTWNYASVIGMMMFLQANSRPDISYAVHQCARFSHFPKKIHEEAVKHICRYLKGTKDKGLLFTPTEDLKLDCYVDAAVQRCSVILGPLVSSDLAPTPERDVIMQKVFFKSSLPPGRSATISQLIRKFFIPTRNLQQPSTPQHQLNP